MATWEASQIVTVAVALGAIVVPVVMSYLKSKEVVALAKVAAEQATAAAQLAAKANTSSEANAGALHSIGIKVDGAATAAEAERKSLQAQNDLLQASLARQFAIAERLASAAAIVLAAKEAAAPALVGMDGEPCP